MAMTEPMWLIDKSALARLAHSVEPETWSNPIERGLVHISNVTRLEVGYSAQSGDVARREFREPHLVAMPVEYLTPKIEHRALEVQLLSGDRAQHHGPSIPDLIIAATAELSGLTILHVDKDIDTITAITGQPATRLACTSPKQSEISSGPEVLVRTAKMGSGAVIARGIAATASRRTWTQRQLRDALRGPGPDVEQTP